MAIIEITTNNRNKCGSCRFFVPKENDWFCGTCVSEKTKVKNLERFYTSLDCVYKELNKMEDITIPEELIANFDTNKIIIEIPLNTIIQSQQKREDLYYNINDKTEMCTYIIKNISDNFANLFDGIFDKAYQSGETWIENPDCDAE